MTVPSDQGFDPAVHMTRMDIAVDNQVAPCTLRAQLKQSKTDPFRQGIFLFVGKTKLDIWPVSAILAYLAVGGKRDGPLIFRYRDRHYLTRQRLVDKVRDALEKAGPEQILQSQL